MKWIKDAVAKVVDFLANFHNPFSDSSCRGSCGPVFRNPNHPDDAHEHKEHEHSHS